MKIREWLKGPARFGCGSVMTVDSDPSEDETADAAVAQLLWRDAESPTPAFRNRLRSTLLQQLAQQEELKMSRWGQFRGRAFKGMAAGLFLVILLGVTWTASPVVRAAVGSWFKVEVQEVDSLFPEGIPPIPVPDGVSVGQGVAVSSGGGSESGAIAVSAGGPGLSAIEFSAGEVNPSAGAVTVSTESHMVTESHTIVEDLPAPALVPLEEAQSLVDFPIRQPTYLPEGYALTGVSVPMPAVPVDDPKVTVIEFKTVSSHYTNAQGAKILLMQQLFKHTTLPDGLSVSMSQLVGRGSVMTVTVGGMPAQFIQGSWKSDGTWDMNSDQSVLRWEDPSGLQYELRGEGLSKEELIRIAESLQ